MPVLTVRQRDDSAGGGTKPFAFVGDVKLSDLKRLLDHANYKVPQHTATSCNTVKRIFDHTNYKIYFLSM